MEKSLFDHMDETEKEEKGQNAPPEFSVSEISQQLKTAVEQRFSYVRVRGELSRVTVAKSGHLYTSLKDENAVLDSICWRGTLQRLGIQPEEGLEVVCTGRLTTYPGRSNYQLIIETMEMAGEGALLKMLEDRRKKLDAEGLFAADKKQDIPFLPQTIGVVTSQTGAVIRDIMHRITDRFPCRVLLWPVMVQGQGAADQVTEAINGFNSLADDDVNKPDVLIVARGGGALEDLMPFNEEKVVRAAAASKIPLISAVGHETDTTLIDYAADLRAPTPTGAAEKAVPVRTQIAAQLLEYDGRMATHMQNKLRQHQQRLADLQRGLGQPTRLLETATQRLDQSAIRLDLGLKNWVSQKNAILRECSASLTPATLRGKIDNYRQHLENMSARMQVSAKQTHDNRQNKLNHVSSLLESLSFKKVLERGFTLITDKKTGKPIKTSTQLTDGDSVGLQFHDGTLSAIVTEKE